VLPSKEGKKGAASGLEGLALMRKWRTAEAAGGGSSITYYEGYVDDVVEGEAGEEAAEGEGPEARGRGRGDGGEEAAAAAEDEGRNSAPMIRDPAEEEAPGYRAAVEYRLRRGDEVAALAYPI
jgi:hypothetical protein